MHQQIRTSPDEDAPFPDKLQRRLDKLAAKGVNVEGVAPEANSTHILFVVTHQQTNAALVALQEWGPQTLPAFTTAIGNQPGGLRALLARLKGDGFKPSNVLVLATRPDPNDVLVSVGIDRYMTKKEWRDHGGWGDPEGEEGATAS